jgi:GAF domain-containing protein/HAMP domain-containing protein
VSALPTTNQALQFTAWFLALVTFILALYIFLLNTRHTANRHVATLLLLIAVNFFVVGMMVEGGDAARAVIPLYAATVPIMQPMLLLVSIVLIKPEWLRGRWQWILRLLYIFCFLPAILTLLDVVFGTRLWYTSMGESYTGGYIPISWVTKGDLAPYIWGLNFYTMGVAPLVFLLYAILFDKKIAPGTRRVAWLLLAGLVIAIISQFWLWKVIGFEITTMITGVSFTIIYAYAVFQQMISERSLQRGRLQTRLTVLILAVALPLLIAVAFFVSTRAAEQVRQQADVQLEATNRNVTTNLATWLDLNTQALQQLVWLPDIQSMDPERQKPILEATDAAYPAVYLVSTTDYYGTNVARSDDQSTQYHGDQAWQIGARDGETVYKVLIGHTSNAPALVIAMPIAKESGEIVGVGMLASDLEALTQVIQASQVGESILAYVVDEHNQVVVHPNPEYVAELKELDSDPATSALRTGRRGAIRFEDKDGQWWRAYVEELENGWGVIVRQSEAEMLSGLRRLQWTAGGVIVLGAMLLTVLTWLTVRQAFQPIDSLTDTATAIAAGDLARVAPVESEDEIGVLAHAFNSMTAQLRELIDSLEQQITNRTRDLERRSAYLEATTEVGRVAASILETDQLIQDVVELIRDRFDLYYVGLFLMDSTGEWAVLQAGTGAAGRALLSRGHQLPINDKSMIGWTIAQGQSRVTRLAEKDAVRLATPELPDTRSEAALPLRSRGRVYGALTVQHTRPDAFDEDTVAVLQAMTDQVAVTLDNARLFTEGQEALEIARRAYGQLGQEAWRELLHSRRDWGYRYFQRGLVPTEGDWPPEMIQASQSGQMVQEDGQEKATLSMPIKISGEGVGALSFRKGEAGEAWTTEEIELLESFVGQLELALDGARLYQDTQRRAAEDRLISEVTARMRETLDMDTVLQTAIREMGVALGLPRVEVRMSSGQARPEQRSRPTKGTTRREE